MMRDSREWLEADGLGGFAMGTVDGIRTRRYHGTLLVATRPPEGRMMLVADVELYAETPAGKFGLSSHDYDRGHIHPDGGCWPEADTCLCYLPDFLASSIAL